MSAPTKRIDAKPPTPEELRRLSDGAADAAIETACYVLAVHARLLNAVTPLVDKYGRGPKSGRDDYVVLISADEFDALRQALDEGVGAGFDTMKQAMHFYDHHAVTPDEIRYLMAYRAVNAEARHALDSFARSLTQRGDS